MIKSKQNNFIYREGTIEDIEQLKTLGLISYGQYSTALTPDNLAILKTSLSKENLYEELIHKAKAFVCENNGKIIGMIFLVPHGNPNHLFTKDWAYIRLLGVNPQYKGWELLKL